MAAPYVGNQDYRGYLSYEANRGNAAAKTLLNYVGNDAQFDPTKTNPILRNTLGDVNTALFKAYSALNTPQNPSNLPSIYGSGGGGGGGSRPVYAPKLDVAAVSAKARAAAENAVNPFYTKQLNDFLERQAAERQRQQAQYETNIGNIEKNLQTTLENSEINRTRTAEDVATNVAEINQTADEFQTDSGQEFDAARLELARQASTGGLGAQKVAKAQDTRNVQEKRQVQQFEQAKQKQDLFKTRTFDDLARSDTLAKDTTERNKKQAKFDLDAYIQDSSFIEREKRNTLEQERLQAIAQEQGNQSRLLFNQYLAGISNPAQYAAAVQTYGGSF